MKSLLICLTVSACVSGCFFNIHRDGKALNSGKLAGIVVLQDVRGAWEETYVRAGFAALEQRTQLRTLWAENDRFNGLRTTPKAQSGGATSMQCGVGEVPARDIDRDAGWLSVGEFYYGEAEGSNLERIGEEADKSYLEILPAPFGPGMKKFVAQGLGEVPAFGVTAPVPVELEGAQVNGLPLTDKTKLIISRSQPLAIEWATPVSIGEYNVMGLDIAVEAKGKKFGLECAIFEKEFAAGLAAAKWNIPASVMSQLPVSGDVLVRVSRRHSFKFAPTAFKYLLLDAYRSWVAEAELN